MKIRNMTYEDISAVCDIAIEFSEFGHFESYGLGLNPEDLSNTLEKMIDIDHFFVLVAEEEGVVCGITGAAKTPWFLKHDQNLMIEQWLWIDQEYRGKGIGKALIIELIEIGKKEGCDKIIMVSLDTGTNTPVDDFYIEQGFLPLETYFIKEI